MQLCKYPFSCIKLTFAKGRCIHIPMVFLRQHIFLTMLVTSVLLFSMSVSHCAWIFQVMDDTPSLSLHLSYNERDVDSQEDTSTPISLLFPPDVLTPHSAASHPRLFSTQLAPDNQIFHLPQICFDIFVPPQNLS